jgi:hypothetical protein
LTSKDDRVFVEKGRKHYRRRYSLTEVKVGAAIVAVLIVILLWVVWKGRHPDPELFKDAPSLVNRAPKTLDRGPIPAGLAPAGWTEGPIAVFGPDNLYEKIDGREGYYKSFGFVRLHFVALTSGERAIDLELYDLGTVANAIGAFSGEVSAPAAIVDGGLVATDRNATYVARGRHYARAIGSDEEEPTRSALEHVASALRALPTEALPRSFGVFTRLGVGPGKISFVTENAFSFGFASNVHVGLMPDGETEVFLIELADEGEAAGMAAKLTAGFLEYGEKAAAPGGVTWVKDRYLSRVSGVAVDEGIVLGVRGAAGLEEGAKLLSALREAAR